MSIYWRIVFNIVFFASSFGFIGPYLVSAKNDIFVIGGIVYIVIIAPAVLYYFNRHFFAAQIAKLTAD